ncbi:MAG: hypothetical protein K2J15_02645 [Muribaculaceae bacterium]|nr:hypothetical protein [Muribaculaceae bacterium]
MKKKRESLTVARSPSEALVMPGKVERANLQSLTQNMFNLISTYSRI